MNFFLDPIRPTTDNYLANLAITKGLLEMSIAQTFLFEWSTIRVSFID